MDLREAAQMALNYLDAPSSKVWAAGTQYKIIQALRAALAQPEQEPVAWFMEGTFEDGTPSFTQVCETDPEFYVPLYAIPPKREWQGLTDEERQECLYSDPIFGMAASTFARAIEAKLREKNFDRPS